MTFIHLFKHMRGASPGCRQGIDQLVPSDEHLHGHSSFGFLFSAVSVTIMSTSGSACLVLSSESDREVTFSILELGTVRLQLLVRFLTVEFVIAV